MTNENTAVAETNENATSTVDIKTENTEYRVYANLDSDGKVIQSKPGSFDYELVSVQDFDKWEKARAEKNEKAGKGVTTQLALQQSVRKYKTGSTTALHSLINDEEEENNIINRGIAAKFSQKVNSKLLETDDEGNLVFQPVEGVFDSLEWLQEETKRRNLSPLEKVERDLKKNVANLSEDDKAKIQAMLAALVGA